MSKSLAETEKTAKDFVKKILEIKRERALVVALHGDLGSGKTAFVQFAAKILGVKENLTSPTFVILKNYSLLSSPYTLIPIPYTLLVHIDAYRLNSGRELLNLGWSELLANPANLIFIEWPENVADIIPKDAIKIDFKFVDENTRAIEF